MRKKIEQYIKTWEQRCYSEGIPDEVPQEVESLVPSYKRICFAIMKNDVQLQSLGFARTKCKIYGELKRVELRQRGVIKDDPQLKLFDLWQMFMMQLRRD